MLGPEAVPLTDRAIVPAMGPYIVDEVDKAEGIVVENILEQGRHTAASETYMEN